MMQPASTKITIAICIQIQVGDTVRLASCGVDVGAGLAQPALNVRFAAAIRRCARRTPAAVGRLIAATKRVMSRCQVTNTATNARCSAATSGGTSMRRSAAIVWPIAAAKRSSVRRSCAGVLVGVALASMRSAFVL